MGVVLLFLVHWVVWGLGLFFMWTPHQRHHLHIVSHVQFAAFLVCECLGFPLQRCSIGWKPLVFFCFLFPLVEETHFLLPTSNVKEPWCDGAFGTCLFEGVSKFPCGSSGKESTCNTGDLGSIPGLGRSPGEGKGYPLQYSGLENPMACIVHGVAKSRTQLSNFHFHWELQALGWSVSLILRSYDNKSLRDSSDAAVQFFHGPFLKRLCVPFAYSPPLCSRWIDHRNLGLFLGLSTLLYGSGSACMFVWPTPYCPDDPSVAV